MPCCHGSERGHGLKTGFYSILSEFSISLQRVIRRYLTKDWFCWVVAGFSWKKWWERQQFIRRDDWSPMQTAMEAQKTSENLSEVPDFKMILLFRAGKKQEK